MYDVKKMKSDIENAASIANCKVIAKFAAAFKRIYVSDRVPERFDDIGVEVTKSKISDHDDIEDIFGGPGFYIIFTDFDVGQNRCRLVLGERCRAVYRGECAKVGRRIQSHLFNRSYKQDYEVRASKYVSKNIGKEFYEPRWTACLKLGDGTNGIDIDDEKYRTSQWFVVVHCMPGSSQAVRQQAEEAFDQVFVRPVANRESA